VSATVCAACTTVAVAEGGADAGVLAGELGPETADRDGGALSTVAPRVSPVPTARVRPEKLLSARTGAWTRARTVL
jgi:hypothetical protein